ncbi:ABC transporter permease [Nocardiopsis aegyptia]|uniref:Putative aldouronate transport system permease protein n=1 Tax=Nocardiopsis aegyptia TaxID=220378 RepID=A0A7Z0JBR6_9ACTN|nr:putative aldouronate transport system permease protein [Nocardiopsis aegyptia]
MTDRADSSGGTTAPPAPRSAAPAATGSGGGSGSDGGRGGRVGRGPRAVRRRGAGAPRPRRRSLRSRLRRDWQLLLMTLPAIALLAVFHYTPTLGNIIAFQDYNPWDGVIGSPWVGFSQFERLFTDARFWSAAGNTLMIAGIQLVFFFPIPIALAILLDSVLSRRMRLVLQSIVYMPHFFSWVLVVTLFQQVLGGAGLFSQILRQNGYAPLDVMTNPDAFLFVVTSQMIWKDAGWGTIIFLAALAAINQNLYESAAVDGAGRWRRMWHITLPGLRPVIILLLILKLGDILNVGFEQFYLQRDAFGANVSEVLDTFIYHQTLVTGNFSAGAVAGLVKGIVGLILIVLANKLAHKMGENGIYRRS